MSYIIKITYLQTHLKDRSGEEWEDRPGTEISDH